MEIAVRANAAPELGEQYSLVKILGIWALAALPMGILSYPIYGFCRREKRPYHRN